MFKLVGIYVLLLAGASDEPHTIPRSDVEDWIIGELEQGREADLAKFEPLSERTHVRASFLRSIIVGSDPSDASTGMSVRIRYGVVDGPLVLRAYDVAREVVLSDFDFRGDVDFTRCHFAYGLGLANCVFQKSAIFDEVTTGRGCSLVNAKFHDLARFKHFRVGMDLNASGCRFCPPTERDVEDERTCVADFSYAHVGGTLLLNNTTINAPLFLCGVHVGDLLAIAADKRSRDVTGEVNLRFLDVGRLSLQGLTLHGPTDLTGSSVSGALTVENAEILGRFCANKVIVGGDCLISDARFGCSLEACARFDEMRVGASLRLEDTDFICGADFRRAGVGEDCEIADTRFHPECDDSARFDELTVGGTFGLVGCQFGGRLDLRSAQIGQDFKLEAGQCWSTCFPANFNSMDIHRATYITDSEFYGPCDFGYVHVGTAISGGLYVTGTNFADCASPVPFSSIRVKGPAMFSSTAFCGPAWFTGTRVDGDIELSSVLFRNDAKFRELAVGGCATFRDCRWLSSAASAIDPYAIEKCPVPPGHAVTRVDGASTSGRWVRRLELEHASIAQNVCLENLDFDVLAARSLATGGRLTLDGVTILDALDLRDAKVGGLQLTDVEHPKVEEPSTVGALRWTGIRWDGFQFGYVVTGNDTAKWADIRAMIVDSHYNEGVYRQLEQFYRRIGLRADANEVHVESRWRACDALENGGMKQRSIVWNYFLHGTVRFGRAPERAFVWCAGFYVLGVVVFSRGRMRQRDEKSTAHEFSRFWYSADVLLPFVNLQICRAWIPISPWLRAVSYWLTLCGWVLVPIGLAALTGIIK